MLLLFIHPISITTVFTGLVSPSAAVYDFTLPYPISYLCSIILIMNTKPHAEIKKNRYRHDYIRNDLHHCCPFDFYSQESHYYL